MKPQPDQSDSPLTETMSAKIDIEDLNDPALGKAIIDAVSTIEGVLEAKIEKGALYVCYDPLVTTEKKIENAVRSSGGTVKKAATETTVPHFAPPSNL